MSQERIVRAWKDEDYRDSLSEAERSALPANPAGLVEVRDADLKLTTGGHSDTTRCTIWTLVNLRNCCC
ncbi:MAG TPA: mersacidin/lichenicidin family type 2 lantibiotic [Thermoanaerobaculia bacterium]|nr:mersacidin/lichenicidin family type 2 lantibiotic [Thermoanaerobaculia bacterium]